MLWNIPVSARIWYHKQKTFAWLISDNSKHTIRMGEDPRWLVAKQTSRKANREDTHAYNYMLRPRKHAKLETFRYVNILIFHRLYFVSPSCTCAHKPAQTQHSEYNSPSHTSWSHEMYDVIVSQSGWLYSTKLSTPTSSTALEYS